jgi:4-hydroxy 2-oxovalerate aldolase
MKLLDCTLRDGGYYNAWDFSAPLVTDYLEAMKAAGVDVVELGFRFLKNEGFKGPYAFTTDSFLETLVLPPGITMGVMINGADLCTALGVDAALTHLFPVFAAESPVELVRIACHYRELEKALHGVEWLAKRGYRVGLNLMQVADRSEAELRELAERATRSSVEVLYIADSMGCMTPDDTARVVKVLRAVWPGALGIHTHDNMGLALANTLRAYAEGVTWLDATVTGMGRGPGNARTEELVIEAQAHGRRKANLIPLMRLIRQHLQPLKNMYGWGTNPYYYLAGKYGIHPTYIQEMLGDARYDEEDMFAVIDHLRAEGGKKYSLDVLDSARQFYQGEPRGAWAPAEMIAGRDVLILGTGPGVGRHRAAIETYIRRARPLVMALNTQESLDPALIDLRVACHPVRLRADAETHSLQEQPLITPASMLPENLRLELGDKKLLDFGLGVEPAEFKCFERHCIIPMPLVLAYALAAATSGRAARILMAGFDGYPPGDPRNDETNTVLESYYKYVADNRPLSLTPTRHRMGLASVYAEI